MTRVTPKVPREKADKEKVEKICVELDDDCVFGDMDLDQFARECLEEAGIDIPKMAEPQDF